MALNVDQLAIALAQVDINLVNQAYIEKEVTPPTIDSATQASIKARAEGYAQAIYTWILTATVNTTVNTNLSTLHPSSTINVAGTAVAQTNPAPVVGSGTGSGTGVGGLS